MGSKDRHHFLVGQDYSAMNSAHLTYAENNTHNNICLKFPEEQEMSEFRDDHRNHLLPHELPWLSFLRHSISNQVPTFLAVH